MLICTGKRFFPWLKQTKKRPWLIIGVRLTSRNGRNRRTQPNPGRSCLRSPETQCQPRCARKQKPISMRFTLGPPVPQPPGAPARLRRQEQLRPAPGQQPGHRRQAGPLLIPERPHHQELQPPRISNQGSSLSVRQGRSQYLCSMSRQLPYCLPRHSAHGHKARK